MPPVSLFPHIILWRRHSKLHHKPYGQCGIFHLIKIPDKKQIRTSSGNGACIRSSILKQYYHLKKSVILMLLKFPGRQVTIPLSDKPLPERDNFLYMENDKIQLFEDRKIRTAWDEEQEEWYFSVVDVVAVLTDSVDPKQYIKKMRSRDPELNSKWGTICTPVQMVAADGKKRKIQAAALAGILRLIQSIPSPKAEPFKAWLAAVGAERIEETIDPELTIDRALATYLQKGYTREWINQRLQAIQVRKELTDEWQDRGVTEGKEYAILTNEITRAWSGMNTQQYKKLKGLKKQNLRDNMSTTELILNMLAETSTTDISKEEKPTTFAENQKVARRGGRVAGIARQALEAETGKPVITSKNAVDFAKLIDEVVKDVELPKEDGKEEV